MSVINVEPTDEVLFVAEDGTPVTGNMILEWCEACDKGEYPGHVIEVEHVAVRDLYPSLHSKKPDVEEAMKKVEDWRAGKLETVTLDELEGSLGLAD